MRLSEGHEILRFDAFEVDVRAGELRKHGVRLRLPEQSLQILLMLLEEPREVVSREDIRLRLWPNQTVVDYDQSIATAVRRLRSALGDSASAPRFIETVSRRGYRFLGEPSRKSGEPFSKPGDASGHYRLLGKLGEGGMGVVYRAEDLRLGREVAIKFPRLGDSGSSDSALRRLQNEARTASSLNHPNICTIHGLEEVEGKPGIVMELVRGVSLAARLKQGPLSLPETVDAASRIAGALAEAHALGMVHRDLKPANIMLTGNGPKILDFGLAHVEQPGSASDAGIPGTLGYMSPEQMRGAELDARSDIFSFGIVVCEMLTARRPFPGDSAATLREGILERDPIGLDTLPAAIQGFVVKCLAKDPASRWQSAREARIELERIGAGKTERLAPHARHSLGRALIWAAAGLLAAIGGLWYTQRGGARAPQPEPREVPLSTLPGNHAFVAFSPDGSRVAYSWNATPELSIYLKPVGTGEPVRVTYGKDDRLAQWSADGSRLAFQRTTPKGHDLMMVDLGSGVEQKLADMGIGLSWSPAGGDIAYIAPYAPFGSGAVLIRSVKSGSTRQLTFPQAYHGDSLPVWSPDGRKIAFTRSMTDSSRELFVIPVDGGDAKQLTFDKVATDGAAWTGDSRELVFVSRRGGAAGLWRIPVSGGTAQRVAVSTHRPAFPAISRQGDRLAFSDSYRDSNIWRFERQTPGSGWTEWASPSASCVICSTEEDDTPRYSPDGRKIAFISKRSGSDEIWISDVDGKYPIQLTSMRVGYPGSPRWSPDGRWIAFDSPAAGSSDIYVVSSGGGTPRQLTFESPQEAEPAWSGDGKWIYFASNKGGVIRVWKVPFSGGSPVQVTQRNGGEPLESADGKHLFYFDSKEGLWSMPLVGTGTEEPIPELASLVRTRAWIVRKEGIYFAESVKKTPAVRFYSFATRKVSTVLTTNLPVLGTAPGLDISPDGRSLLYTQVDQRKDGLTMVENFR